MIATTDYLSSSSDYTTTANEDSTGTITNQSVVWVLTADDEDGVIAEAMDDAPTCVVCHRRSGTPGGRSIAGQPMLLCRYCHRRMVRDTRHGRRNYPTRPQQQVSSPWLPKRHLRFVQRRAARGYRYAKSSG